MFEPIFAIFIISETNHTPHMASKKLTFFKKKMTDFRDFSCQKRVWHFFLIIKLFRYRRGVCSIWKKSKIVKMGSNIPKVPQKSILGHSEQFTGPKCQIWCLGPPKNTKITQFWDRLHKCLVSGESCFWHFFGFFMSITCRSLVNSDSWGSPPPGHPIPVIYQWSNEYICSRPKYAFPVLPHSLYGTKPVLTL